VMATIRQTRVADRIRQELSNLLLRQVKDPRLRLVTVTEVTIDRDLAYANVYVNAMGEEARQEEVLEALNGAKGFLRSEIGSRIQLRRVPQLLFHWDPSLEHGEQISRLLDSLALSEEEE